MRSDKMKGHLLAQFADKRNLYALLETLGEEMDEIEAAFSQLGSARWIDTAQGAQLDGLGEIVGQTRQINEAVQLAFFGFRKQPNAQGFEMGRFRNTNEQWLASVSLSDPEYRPMLWQKVAKNSSDGTLESMINSLSFIFDTDKIIIEELGNAKLGVAIGRRLNANTVSLAKAVDLMVRAGGVGIKWRAMYAAGSYLGFLGQPEAKGFEAGSFADKF